MRAQFVLRPLATLQGFQQSVRRGPSHDSLWKGSPRLGGGSKGPRALQTPPKFEGGGIQGVGWGVCVGGAREEGKKERVAGVGEAEGVRWRFMVEQGGFQRSGVQEQSGVSVGRRRFKPTTITGGGEGVRGGGEGAGPTTNGLEQPFWTQLHRWPGQIWEVHGV